MSRRSLNSAALACLLSFGGGYLLGRRSDQVVWSIALLCGAIFMLVVVNIIGSGNSPSGGTARRDD